MTLYDGVMPEQVIKRELKFNSLRVKFYTICSYDSQSRIKAQLE